MPELPEVETVKKGLADFVVNKTIKSVEFSGKKLRFPYPRKFGKKILNKTILNIDRRAKYSLFYLSENFVIIAHLGMSGTIHLIEKNNLNKFTNTSFYNSPNLPKKHNHVEIQFKDLIIEILEESKII